MNLRRALSQLTPDVPPSTLVCALLTIAATVLGLESNAQAQLEDIYVVTAGGTDRLVELAVYDPIDDSPHIESGADLVLELADDTMATYTDIAVLPGGYLMLADGAGRQAVWFDEQGRQVDQVTAPTGGDPARSAVVASFLDPNTPEQIVIGYDAPGRLELRDLVDGDELWVQPLVVDGASGRIGRAVVLPDHLLAAAVSWPEIGVSAVQTISRSQPSTPKRTIWSEVHPEASDGDPVVDGLHPVRDVMAESGGDFLIASAGQISIVDPDDGLRWKLSIGDDPALGGEFEAARWLDSGFIVVATRQPGLWNHPHTNHRVHLIDPDADDPVVDTSPSFGAAPLAMDSARGHGGTGTRHYFADANEQPGAAPDQLSVTDGPTLEPDRPEREQEATLGFSLRNDADDPVTVRRIEFRTADDDCADIHHVGDLPHLWWSDGINDTLEAGDDWSVDGAFVDTTDISVGDHCGQITVVGRDGTAYLVGDHLPFSIEFPDGEGPVVTDEIARHGDAGYPGDAGPFGDGASNGGCACSATSSAPFPVLFVVVFGVLIARLRTSAKRPVFSD